MKRITIDLDDDLKRRLDIYCAMIQRSKVDVVREWIQQKLYEAKKQQAQSSTVN